jgi:hypothetical protein
VEGTPSGASGGHAPPPVVYMRQKREKRMTWDPYPQEKGPNGGVMGKSQAEYLCSWVLIRQKHAPWVIAWYQPGLNPGIHPPSCGLTLVFN